MLTDHSSNGGKVIAIRIVLIIGLILLFVGMGMVLSEAFRSRLSWAIGIVVFPLVYPIYAILNWAEARIRNGFMVSIVGSLLVATSLYAGVANDLVIMAKGIDNEQVRQQLNKFVTKVPTASPEKEPLPNDATAGKISLPEGKSYDPLYSDDEFAHTDIEPLPPAVNDPARVESKPAILKSYRETTFSELDLHHGKSLKLTTNQGQTKEGKLIDHTEESLLLELPYEKGFVAFEYNYDDIAKVLVYDSLAPEQHSAEQVKQQPSVAQESAQVASGQ